MEQRLKIIFLVSNDHSTDQRMRRICLSLHNAGHSIHIVGRKQPSNTQTETFPYLVHLLPLKRKNGPFFYLELMLQQIQFVQQIKEVSIISSVDADTIWAASKLAKKWNIPHVHDAHEWFSEVPELLGKSLKKAVWKWVERKGLETVRSAYTVSETLKRYYDTISPVNFHLIRNYPIAKEVTNQDTKQFDVLYQGAVNKGRCLELLLEVCKKQHFSLCICGKGDLFEQLSSQYGDIEHIEFKGTVSPKELHRITQRARIGFNMLDNTSQSYNGALPNKTFDYIQAEIPQLISASEELTKLNQTCPFALVLNAKQEKIAEGIRTLLEDKAVQSQLLRNIKKLKEKFIWKKEEQLLIKIYEQYS